MLAFVLPLQLDYSAITSPLGTSRTGCRSAAAIVCSKTALKTVLIWGKLREF